MTEQTARYPRGKLLTIGAALLVFAAAKVAALLWWQQQEQPETAARAQCAADGVYLPFCASGRRDWIVEWQADGRRFQAAFATE